MKYFRKCGGRNDFNSGISHCPVNPGYPKGLILVERGVKLPEPLTLESFKEAIHADRPNRIYPVKIVEEYAPSGGEAQTSTTGYGAMKVTGYSARSDAFTLDEYDMLLRKNVVEAKNIPFDVYILDSDNRLFGETLEDEFKGAELSGISVGGQDFDSSGQQSQNILTIYYKDIERHWKNMDFIKPDFDMLPYMEGLVSVDLIKEEGSANEYKLYEIGEGNLDITHIYGDLIAKSANEVLDGATGATYTDGVLTLTTTDSAVPKLKKPSVLIKSGISGIEQL